MGNHYFLKSRLEQKTRGLRAGDAGLSDRRFPYLLDSTSRRIPKGGGTGCFLHTGGGLGGPHWDLFQITFPYSLITEYAGIESKISFIFRFAGENRYQNTIGAAYGARTVRSVVQTYGNLILIFCN